MLLSFKLKFYNGKVNQNTIKHPRVRHVFQTLGRFDNYPLIPEDLVESSRYLCSSIKTINTGNITNIVPALITPFSKW